MFVNKQLSPRRDFEESVLPGGCLASRKFTPFGPKTSAKWDQNDTLDMPMRGAIEPATGTLVVLVGGHDHGELIEEAKIMQEAGTLTPTTTSFSATIAQRHPRTASSRVGRGEFPWPYVQEARCACCGVVFGKERMDLEALHYIVEAKVAG